MYKNDDKFHLGCRYDNSCQTRDPSQRLPLDQLNTKKLHQEMIPEIGLGPSQCNRSVFCLHKSCWVRLRFSSSVTR